ncbi:hypothetical protein K493DRAFT_315426 [Basidiobolus meristosporus CBS 931.73]|uniref:CBM21 domain-containing protein n=1 Tax=Basidiobolus meristosporus CBS 931.73 TaxID=1314790 RepID=A0A1Y1Y976_9FUNG|nr:hypothetical protein K493DRAFT_315426 [Basidiobolus meristosporus CBS 931.73]|eukprot:ORX94570.1 hypothetical protein K493DRAFT_315426 [Basidiobolus meristosporus CBS 931.73]
MAPNAPGFCLSTRESHTTSIPRPASQSISLISRQRSITGITNSCKPENPLSNIDVNLHTDLISGHKKPVFSIPLRPQLLRKKSGEVVKSALKGKENDRPKSLPTSPTKFVHFDAQLEYIKLFMKGEKPQTISNPGSDDEDGTSSDDDYYDQDDEVSLSIRLPNFPPPIFPGYNSKIVSVQDISLSEDKLDVIGTIQVANLAYRKHVAVRYTFDFWQTVEEVSADFKQSSAHDHENYVGVDKFDFSINIEERISLKLGSPKKTMFFAVKYQVNGEEFWDNNDGMNYHVEFVLSKIKNTSEPWDLQAQPVDINKGRPIKTSSYEGADPGGYFSSGSPLNSLRSASTKKLSSRYDFGASLSALLASEARNSRGQLESSDYFDFPTSDQIDQQHDSYDSPSAYTTSSLSQMLNHEYDSYSSVSVESPFGSNSWEEPGYLLNSYNTLSRNYVSNASSYITSKPISIGNNSTHSRSTDTIRSKNLSHTGAPYRANPYGISPPATCIRG